MEFTIGICDDLEEERLALANMIRTYAQKRGKSVRLRLFSSGMELLDSAPEPGGFRFFFWIFLCPINQGLR
ncbi:MAG TPA: hypothetical protein H9826_08515 [Candidatus Intestinimonas merdavium]|uniref:Uncharacterized protein n=1 Tax=Candidatus Intestinimonas merdavium TaxID=2838622 RepID=A0A9D1Z555_9FIRM|nr:hypothetical protein [Candidatus Intestinimonas merdavium]